MKAGKILLILSLVFGALYVVGVIAYFIYVSASASATLNSMKLGAYNAIAQYSIGYVIKLMLPSLIVSGIAAILNALNLVKLDIPWIALAAGIAYVVALFLAYGFYWTGNVAPAVLSFIAFGVFMKARKGEDDTPVSVTKEEDGDGN